jgi:tetratricopeptide (TPR) repeat protein
MIVELELNGPYRQQALQQLRSLAQERPRDVDLARRLAELAWTARDWASLERYEKKLRDLEGEDGTLWRLFRAHRLLEQTSDIRDPRYREIAKLADELQTLRPKWPSRYALRGQMAEARGLYSEAILAYQEAMRLGDQRVKTAVALIDLLTRQARFREAEQIVDQFRSEILRFSPLASLATAVYEQQGETQQALRLAKDWVRQHPDDPAGHIRLGRALLLTMELNSPTAHKVSSQAEQAFRKAIQLEPTNFSNWLSLFTYHARVQNTRVAHAKLDELAGKIQIQPWQKALVLAQLHEALKNSFRAAQHYRESIDLAPNDVRVRILERASQFFVGFDPAQAEEYCRHILQRVSDSSAAYRTLIAILTHREDGSSLREAFQLLENARGVVPTSLHQRSEATLLLSRDAPGDRVGAIRILEQLVNTRQPAAQDQLQLARAYEGEGRWLPAAEILQALARKPDAPPNHIAAYLQFLYRASEASPVFLRQVEGELARLHRDPNNTVRLLLALQQGIRGAKQTLSPDDPALQQQIRQHVDQFIQTALRSPGGASDDRVQSLLLVLLREDCIEEAVRVCRFTPPLLETGQVLWPLVVALTRIQASKEVFGRCESVVRDLLQKSPNDPQVLYASGLFYLFLREEQGITLLRRALAAAPDRSDDVMNLLAFALACQGEKLDEALKLIENAISAAGPLADYLDTRAVILLRQGNAESARDALQMALSSSPSDPLKWLHLAEAFDQLGQSSQSRDAWLQARVLNLARAPMSMLDRRLAAKLQNQFDN